MTGISRRTVLRGSSAAAGAAVFGNVVVNETAAWAAGDAGAAAAPSGPHEEAARDARMRWRRLPDSWQTGPFLGNGSLGVQVERGTSGNVVTFRLSNDPPGDHDSYLSTVAGELALTFVGTVTAVAWELDLWNAELSGTLTTTRGSAAFSAVVLRAQGVLLVSLTPSDGELGAEWSLRPADGSPQAIGWRERSVGTRRLVAATVGSGDVDAALAADLDGAVAAHRSWWHAYYRRSFVSVPDRRLQRFYWIQLYKLAAAVGPDAAVDGALTAQVGHPLAVIANHLELDAARTAWSGWADAVGVSGRQPWTLRPGAHGLLDVPGIGLKAGPAGNPVLTWGLFDLWHSYRHTMDSDALRGVLHPALTRALSHYSEFLRTGADGRLHLPLTHSPDYADVEDSTYDLALLRWAAGTMVEAERRLGIDTPNAVARDVVDRLTGYHQNATGVMIGRDTPLTRSHPHPSHLLWLYPLREAPMDRELATRSFAHWAGKPESWHGTSYAAASAMATVLGSPEEALRYLTHFVGGNVSADTALTPNTMYRDGTRPSMEAPFAAARSLLEALVGGAAGTLTVLGGASSTWRDVCVAGLRADGGFVVDASRANGRTEWIRVHSEAGEPLTVRHDIDGDVDVRDERGAAVRSAVPGPGSVSLNLAAGQTAVIRGRTANRTDPAPRLVTANGTARPWGLTEEER